MSAHSFVLRSTSKSEEDYADILLYTVKTWGAGQANTYRMGKPQRVDRPPRLRASL